LVALGARRTWRWWQERFQWLRWRCPCEGGRGGVWQLVQVGTPAVHP
jgi:hypothetical protein